MRRMIRSPRNEWEVGVILKVQTDSVAQAGRALRSEALTMVQAHHHHTAMCESARGSVPPHNTPV